jgi:hypothetical protein
VLLDNFPPTRPDECALTEMSHEAMAARWQQGLVTPMSSTMTTFARTDGSWWTAGEDTWQRIPQADRNERLDYHHDRFAAVSQVKGPVGTNSPSGVFGPNA